MTEHQNTTQTGMVPIADLVADPKNSRVHSEKNIGAIKGSLSRFGQRKPIVVGKDNVVLAGNGTLQAASELGWEKIWCVFARDLEGYEATAYSLADNRTSELATWDYEGLSEDLKLLADKDFDLLSIGWDEHELEPLFEAKFESPGEEEDSEDDLKVKDLDDQEEEENKKVKFSDSNWQIIKDAVVKMRSKSEDVDLPSQDAIALICSEWLERYAG
jgi:ParB-like chromosome segregation protein Spo0J